MSPLLIPGEKVKSTFVFNSETQMWLKKGSKSRETMNIRPFRSKRKSGIPSLVMECSNGDISVIYRSKVYKEQYGYGRIKDSVDLVILDFRAMIAIDLIVIPNGWIYFDMLLLDYINNNKGKL